MSTRKLSNVKLDDYREFLRKAGCNYVRTEGGHEIWTRRDLTRPIVVQTHESPVPEFIIKNALRNLGLKKKDFFNILFDLDDKKESDEQDVEPVLDDDDPCFCGSGEKYSECHGKEEYGVGRKWK
ncbi:SEC-C domain-containing protein [Bacteroides sp. OttesenSCG-928-E20]|nr:SEC-C domain-containing protein [Bacteroides sp. OttesenSCG-928-E20]